MLSNPLIPILLFLVLDATKLSLSLLLAMIAKNCFMHAEKIEGFFYIKWHKRIILYVYPAMR